MKRLALLATIALCGATTIGFAASCQSHALKMEQKHCHTLKKGHARNSCIKKLKAHQKACHPVKKQPKKSYHHPAHHNVAPAITMPKPEEMTTGKDITPASTPTAAQ